jgi:hypothetical protein
MCINFQLTPQRLLKSAFSIRAFRGSEIRKISTKVELMLKSQQHGHGGSSAPEGKMARSKSNENLPSSRSQMNIEMMSHTLAIKEVCGFYYRAKLMAFNEHYLHNMSNFGLYVWVRLLCWEIFILLTSLGYFSLMTEKTAGLDLVDKVAHTHNLPYHGDFAYE